MTYDDLELELAEQIEVVRRTIPVERRMITQLEPLSSPSIHAAMTALENSIFPEVDEACLSFARDKAWPDLPQRVRELIFVRLTSLRAYIYSPGHKIALTRLFETEPSLGPQEWLGRLLREWWQAEGRDSWLAQTVAFADDIHRDLPGEFFSGRQ